MKEQRRFILDNNLILDIKNLDAFYSDVQILRNVSFKLKQGRVLGLLGRNGAGKSTCIGALSGLVFSRATHIKLANQNIDRLTPEQICYAGIGLVPQGRRIFPTLTVEENLLVANRRNHKKRWTLSSIVNLFPRLGERKNQLAGSLSGGEQQMLAIGRALATNPRLLLLDEPSEGLAPQIINDLLQTIVKLKNEGLSIILVEQNLEAARQVADSIVVLSTGQVAFDGSLSEFELDQQRVGQLLGISDAMVPDDD